MTDSHAISDATVSLPTEWAFGSAAPRSSGRLLLTSELRAATGLSRTHMDFYLRAGVVRPTARTESGYLLFDEAELATLRAVVAWRQEGVGLREILRRLGRSDE
jgi:hypothetical protein